MAEAESGTEGEGEEEELPQWMPECDDCDNPAEHNCTTCGDKLCPGCKDNHLLKKRTRDHQVVPYSAGMRAAQKSASMCTEHPGERYQMYCNPCGEVVCTSCVTQSHADHSFISITQAFSDAREKALAYLETLTKIIRPRVEDECQNAKITERKLLREIQTTKDEMMTSAKQLHKEVDIILESNLKLVEEAKEKDIMPLLQKWMKDSDDTNRKVEIAVKEYEDKLRSDNPVDLIIFIKERKSNDPESLYPSTATQHFLLPEFKKGCLSRQTLQSLFGALTKRKTGYVAPIPPALGHNEESGPGVKSEKVGKRIMKSPQRISELTLDIKNVGSLKHFQDKLWILGHERRISLVDRNGRIIRTVHVGCNMYNTSGMYSMDDGELIFCDTNGKCVKKILLDFTITLFSTGKARPRGICQLQSGDWVVCMANEGVLREYDGAGKAVSEIGKGHLQKPYYVTVNKVNGDVCVSDSFCQVIVLSSGGEKRFTYTGHGDTGTRFTPWDLCCDQLGNILITDCDYHRVHIIDRDGHFLQHLVSGTENISCPITIDIDDRGYAWVGELNTRKVKAYKYLS